MHTHTRARHTRAPTGARPTRQPPRARESRAHAAHSTYTSTASPPPYTNTYKHTPCTHTPHHTAASTTPPKHTHHRHRQHYLLPPSSFTSTVHLAPLPPRAHQLGRPGVKFSGARTKNSNTSCSDTIPSTRLAASTHTRRCTRVCASRSSTTLSVSSRRHVGKLCNCCARRRRRHTLARALRVRACARVCPRVRAGTRAPSRVVVRPAR